MSDDVDRRQSRNVGAFLIIMIIAEETEEVAFAKWRHCNETVDRIAIGNVFGAASADTSGKDSSTRALATEIKDVAPVPEGAVNLNFATLVGSYSSVASMLDEAGQVPGTAGIMLIFDDYVQGMENFGRKVQPLMKSRQAALARA
jgi:pyrimidine oxygenase